MSVQGSSRAILMKNLEANAIEKFDNVNRSLSAGKIVKIGDSSFYKFKNFNFMIAENGSVTGLSAKDFTRSVVLAVSADIIKKSDLRVLFANNIELKELLENTMLSDKVKTGMLEKIGVFKCSSAIFKEITERTHKSREGLEAIDTLGQDLSL